MSTPQYRQNVEPLASNIAASNEPVVALLATIRSPKLEPVAMRNSLGPVPPFRLLSRRNHQRHSTSLLYSDVDPLRASASMVPVPAELPSLLQLQRSMYDPARGPCRPSADPLTTGQRALLPSCDHRFEFPVSNPS